MDRLLHELRSQGHYSSSGVFTLDALKARLKLARYQLPGPVGPLLKLVQAAVQLRAFQVEFDTAGWWSAVFSLPPETRLDPLLIYLDDLSSAPPGGVRDVALALTALAGQSRALRLDFWLQGHEGLSLTMEDDRQKLTPAIEGGRQPCGFRITWAPLENTPEPVLTALSGQACFAPVRVILNRRTLTDLPITRVRRVVAPPEAGCPGFRVPELERPVGFSALWGEAGMGLLLAVRSGVTLRRLLLPEHTNLVAMIEDYRVPTDLSDLQLRAGPELDELKARALELARRPQG